MNNHVNYRLSSRRRETVAEEIYKARDEGLENTGKEAEFFRALEIGEWRLTSYMTSTKGKAGKLREQWWAPTRLVRFNDAMKREGFSSKLRAKAIRAMAAGQELPERFYGAMARYTEELLLRQG